jgi:putative protease
MEELFKVGSRGYTENFLGSPPNSRDMLYDQPRVAPSHQPVGIVRQTGTRPLIEVRNPLQIGEEIEYLDRNLKGQYCRITAMTDVDGVPLERANPGNQVFLQTEPPAGQWSASALLRRRCA